MTKVQKKSGSKCDEQQKIEMIIKQFQKIKLREPTNREILDELGDDVNDVSITNARNNISSKSKLDSNMIEYDNVGNNNVVIKVTDT